MKHRNRKGLIMEKHCSKCGLIDGWIYGSVNALGKCRYLCAGCFSDELTQRQGVRPELIEYYNAKDTRASKEMLARDKNYM